MTLTLVVTKVPLTRLAHVFEKHTQCRREQCMICDGGLSLCTVCGALEGALLDTCPGVKLTPAQHEWNYSRWCKLSVPKLKKIYEGAGL